VSEEAENKHSTKEVWESTIATFLTKFIFALTFIIPILFFELSTAIIVSIVRGIFWVAAFSYYVAKLGNVNPFKVVSEHVLIAIIVIIITHYVGDWIAMFI